jgi:cytochrome c oxidase subunit I
LDWRAPKGVSWWDWFRYWFLTQNSTRTGVVWIVASGAFLFLAGFFALQMRAEMLTPGRWFRSPERYAELFSMHGTYMIFFFAVPVFFGFASAVLPRALGTTNLAFPRLNNLDLWLIIAGGSTLEIGSFFRQRPIGGWTGYPPLTLDAYQPGNGTDWWIWGIFLETLGTLLASVNVLATIFRRRHPDLPFLKMPIFAWTMFFTSLLVLVAAPFLLTALLLLFLDRNVGTGFFSPTDGSLILLWQDLFWFYSHPATYVMLLPAFGIVTVILARFSGRPIYSYVLLVVGTAGVWLFSYLVWWHHMFTTGMHPTARLLGSVNTWGVSIFSGIVVFAWVASLWRGRLRFTTPMLWALGVIVLFTIGGADGVYMAFIPLDYYLHDSYWLVGHFHYIIFGSTVMAAIAGIYYWFPAILGRQLDERLGKWHFWVTLVGVNLSFFPMHNLGMMGVQRRVATYDPEYLYLNWLIGLGTALTALAQVLFVYNIVRTVRRGKRADDDVWGGPRLSLAGPMADDAQPAADRQEGSRP